MMLARCWIPLLRSTSKVRNVKRESRRDQMINERFLHGRDALDNRFDDENLSQTLSQEISYGWTFSVLHFDNKKLSDAQDHRFVLQCQLLGQGKIKVEVVRDRSVRWSKMVGFALINTLGPRRRSPRCDQ